MVDVAGESGNITAMQSVRYPYPGRADPVPANGPLNWFY